MKTWIVRAALLAAGAAFACGASAAEQYDDPAVAICEYDFHKGREAPPEYVREGFEIDGTTVRITYSVRLMNLPPKQRDFACKFVLRDSGYFIEGPFPDGGEYCVDHISAFRDEMKAHRPGSSEYARIYAEIDRCASLLEAMRDHEVRRVAYMTGLLGAGIYPISPEETNLSED